MRIANSPWVRVADAVKDLQCPTCNRLQMVGLRLAQLYARSHGNWARKVNCLAH